MISVYKTIVYEGNICTKGCFVPIKHCCATFVCVSRWHPSPSSINWASFAWNKKLKGCCCKLSLPFHYRSPRLSVLKHIWWTSPHSQSSYHSLQYMELLVLEVMITVEWGLGMRLWILHQSSFPDWPGNEAGEYTYLTKLAFAPSPVFEYTKTEAEGLGDLVTCTITWYNVR